MRYFGDYELLEEIARGGMGVVYKARQVNLDRTVALKMFLSGRLASEDDVRRFHQEAEAAANLHHPGIVPIYEIGQHHGQHFFSMAFVDGPSLAEILADGPLPPREAVQIVQQVAEAIADAHTRGVIHRDLKPAQRRPRVTWPRHNETGRPRITRMERRDDAKFPHECLGQRPMLLFVCREDSVMDVATITRKRELLPVNNPKFGTHHRRDETIVGKKVEIGTGQVCDSLLGCTFKDCEIRLRAAGRLVGVATGRQVFQDCLIWPAKKQIIANWKASFERCYFQGKYDVRFAGPVVDCDFSAATLSHASFLQSEPLGDVVWPSWPHVVIDSPTLNYQIQLCSGLASGSSASIRPNPQRIKLWPCTSMRRPRILKWTTGQRVRCERKRVAEFVGRQRRRYAQFSQPLPARQAGGSVSKARKTPTIIR